MGFMQLVIYDAAETFTTDCPNCGSRCYFHSGIEMEASEPCKSICEHCQESLAFAEWDSVGMQYAGRYSAPGYMDCTDWSYGTDADALLTELREMYGDEDGDE